MSQMPLHSDALPLSPAATVRTCLEMNQDYQNSHLSINIHIANNRYITLGDREHISETSEGNLLLVLLFLACYLPFFLLVVESLINPMHSELTRQVGHGRPNKALNRI